jgi:hypothetical protein
MALMEKQPSIVQIAPVLAVIFVMGGLFAGLTMMEEQKKEEPQLIVNTAPYVTAPSGYRIIVRTRGHHHHRCQFRRDIGVFDSIDAY